VGEVDRAGIDHGPLEQPLHGQLLDRLEALGRGHGARRVGSAEDRQGRIDDHVLLLPDALDDATVDLGIVALAAGTLVVGMDVNDRGAGPGAGDALCHQLADGDRHAGLQGACPRSVQRRFQPNRSSRHPPHSWENLASRRSHIAASRLPNSWYGAPSSRPSSWGSGLLQREHQRQRLDPEQKNRRACPESARTMGRSSWRS
jgi:hypothetical protein